MEKNTSKIMQFYLLLFTVIVSMSLFVYADNSSEQATDLASDLNIVLSDGRGSADITDNSIYTFMKFSAGDTLTITSSTQIDGIYIKWNKIPGEWSYETAGKTYTCGKNGFLHEYVKLASPNKSVTVYLPEAGAQISDIYAFSKGTLPDWVEIWNSPCSKADILLFSTHSDDEQLFFAGLLPYYAIEAKADVQVVYMTSHWDTVTRPHEQITGLWTVGIRNYPVIPDFPDDARSLGSTSESRETVLARAQSVYDENEWIEFQVEMLRRFKPQVVVGHDLDGEYRHGAHILNSDALIKAITLGGNSENYPDSALEYNTWEIKKLYFHLYSQNQIVMDWDTPYESMGGLTPFEISKLGYACHFSQQWTWFTDWISPSKASEITKYSPCMYGLFYTSVGPDTGRNDMLENITLYSEIARQQEEADRKAQEEENKRKQEQEQSSSNDEQSLLPSDDINQDKSKNFLSFQFLLFAAVAVFAILAFAIFIRYLKVRSRRRKRKHRHTHPNSRGDNK